MLGYHVFVQCNTKRTRRFSDNIKDNLLPVVAVLFITEIVCVVAFYRDRPGNGVDKTDTRVYDFWGIYGIQSIFVFTTFIDSSLAYCIGTLLLLKSVC